MNNKVKVGIAGLGRSGWNSHRFFLLKIPAKYEIVAVLDTDRQRLDQAGEELGVRTYSNFDSFVNDKDIEVVVIATPSHLHEQQTIKALRAGKHVVVEKPMALTLEEADAMIEVAQDEDRILTVFQSQRYSPDFLKVKQIVDSGILGRIVQIKMQWHSFSRRWDWQTVSAFGGGVLYNNGSHALDLAMQFIEDDEPQVQCHLDKTLTLGDATDHLKVILKGKQSPVVDVEVTSACAYPQDLWVVMGTRGGLKGNRQEMFWKYFNPDELPQRQVDIKPTSDRSYNQEDIPWNEDSCNFEETGQLYKLDFYLDFYRTLRKGLPLKITPQSARRALWVIQQCLDNTYNKNEIDPYCDLVSNMKR